MSDKSISSQTYHTHEMDVKSCRHQHEVLVTYIQYALQCWGPLDDHSVSYWIDASTVTPWKRSSPIQATPELKRVLTRARILSEDCCKELPPLEAVLRHADRSQAYVDIVKEIQWCTSVVYHGRICRNVTRRSAPELKDFPWQAKIGYQEKLLLEKAEQEDWQQLMLELPNYYDRHHDCSAEECGNVHAHLDPCHCLAAQAMQRFFPQESEETGGNEPDHKSLLWRFDPEVVKHGRPLGSGGFGLVSEVMWLGSRYAQKIFNVSELHSLAAEAEALVKLNHPHIVKVYAYSEKSLLMDLMCTDLHNFMESQMKGGARVQPFSLPVAMDLILQIADAVSYLHSQNVAHRDLKSSNILVNPVNTPGLDEDDGFVFAKIADFGLAKVKRDITSRLSYNVGTRKWMAPEIFRANMENDHLEHAFPMKADVYSFGIICFEILTGQQPFSDEPLTTLYSKLTAPFPLRPQLPSSCPTNLASLICECWDADPRKRPTFGDVCRVLRYIKGLPTLIALNVDAKLDPQPVPIDGEWPFGRLTSMVKKQGPWGASGKRQEDYTVWTIGPLYNIKGIQFDLRDSRRQLSGFLANDLWLGIGSNVGGGRGLGSEQIQFDPDEFIIQVEGSISFTFGVVALSFITTKQKYGPFGTFKGGTRLYDNFKRGTTRFYEELMGETIKPFRSDRGRVVGFTGYTHRLNNFVLFEVHTIPNIIGCLQQYLGNEESFV